MNLRFYTYILISVIVLLTMSCRQSKYVQEGYYLLDENVLHFPVEDKASNDWTESHDLLDEGEMAGLVKPSKNSGLKLFIYNRIDTTRYNKQTNRKKEKFRRKNARKIKKEVKINDKRIAKARKKGKDGYKKKTKNQKSVRLGWRDWIVNQWGEGPVIVDTGKVERSMQQLEIYLSKKGFKNAVITDSIVYNEKKRKGTVNYYIKPGEPYRIASISFDPLPRNKGLITEYKRMVRKEGTDIEVGDLLDEENLEDERNHYSKYMKDRAYFGFTTGYINFIVDTTVGNHQANVVLYIKEKTIPNPSNPDTTMIIAHKVFQVDKITFKLYNEDSLDFKDYSLFKSRCDDLGLNYFESAGKYTLLDTVLIIDTVVVTHRLT